MVGDFDKKTNKGIIPRAFNYIYNEINKISKIENENNENNDNKNKYNIYLSFIQIYLETIQDLLDPTSKDIRIREDPDKGVYLENVQWIRVTSPEECADIFHMGERNRVTESTKMNAHSSRSHAILIIRIEKSIKVSETNKITNISKNIERIITKSHLYLVDLAGSERVKKTNAREMRLEEAKKINYSLLVLGNCISALIDPKKSHISYRDSKLTRLLQESLGGNAKTSLIVTVSPSSYNTEETISSLNFAMRAMKVQNKPIINKSIDYQALSIKLQDDLDKLNDKYSLLKIEYDKVLSELEKFKSGEMYIDMQKKLSSLSNDTSTEGSFRKKSKNENNKSDNDKSIENDDFFKEQLKKLESFYENLIKNKSKEFENILQKVDGIIYEKENQIENLNEQVSNLTQVNKEQSDNITDLIKEREDLQKSVLDLTTKIEQNELNNNKNKSNTDYQKEINKLNNTIASLENKIIEYEEMNYFPLNLKEKIENDINSNINNFQNDINKLVQDKNNYIIKISQNEIKIKLSQNQKNVVKNLTGENKRDDIFSKQKENYNLNIEKEFLLKKIELYEKKINSLKNSNLNIEQIISNFTSLDKIQLILEIIKKEINNKVNEEQINFYENFINILKEKDISSYSSNLSSENELNKVIDHLTNLLPKYQEHLNLLINLNRELDESLNEIYNTQIINNLKCKIEELQIESKNLNNIKENQIYINIINLNKCPQNIEILTTCLCENFIKLIDTYYNTSSFICQLMTALDDNNCFIKKLISNLSSFIQVNVKDDLIKQNTIFKLGNIFKNISDNSEIYSKLENVLIDFVNKIQKNNNEKDKEIAHLNERIDLYIKQIDTNTKYSGQNNSEIQRLQKKIESQNVLMENTKKEIDSMRNSISKLNSLLKINNSDSILDVIKIQDMVKIYQEQVSKLSDKLENSEFSILEEKKLKARKLDLKDINTSRFLFKEYFVNLTKFSKDLISYCTQPDN